MTDAMPEAPRDRLPREELTPGAEANLTGRLAASSERLRSAYDTQPVSRKEWDMAAGDEG